MSDPLKEAMETVDKGVEELVDHLGSYPLGKENTSSTGLSPECARLKDMLRKKHSQLFASKEDIERAMHAVSCALDKIG